MVKLSDYRTAWRTLLNSEAGAKLVEWLELTFDGEKLHAGEDTHTTSYRLGGRDVVRTLKDIKERSIHGE